MVRINITKASTQISLNEDSVMTNCHQISLKKPSFLFFQNFFSFIQVQKAKVSKKKSDISFIHSGSAHKFFQKEYMSEERDEITPKTFGIAELVSKMFREEKVKMNLRITITRVAHYVPGSSSSIIASHITLDRSEVHMTPTLRNEATCQLDPGVFRVTTL